MSERTNHEEGDDPVRAGALDVDSGAPDASGLGVGRVFALLSIPVVLFAVGAFYLIEYSDFSDDFRRIAGSERANGVRYAIEHTEPRFVPHLMFTAGRAPKQWDARQAEAVVDLVERAGWPVDAERGVTAAALLSRPCDQWNAAEAAVVETLLQRFRAFHRAR